MKEWLAGLDHDLTEFANEDYKAIFKDAVDGTRAFLGTATKAQFTRWLRAWEVQESQIRDKLANWSSWYWAVVSIE